MRRHRSFQGTGILLALLLVHLLPAMGAGEDECDAVIVDEMMIPVSGYLVTRGCLEEYGPWDEEGLAACNGGLWWTTLTEGDLEGETEYVYLVCEGSSPFLVREGSEEEEVTWGSLKALFR